MDAFRVMTYNVRGLQDDLATLARVVRAADPDVLCVQESPLLWRWRSRCARLARTCGLTYVSGGGTSAGTVVLANLRVRVDRTGAELLSGSPRLHRRGFASAVLERQDVRMRVTSIHLGLDQDERRRHAGELLAALRPDGDLAYDVVAGDLNEAPGSPAWALLIEAGFTDLVGPGARPTFPARRPQHRIDAVLARPRPDGMVGADVPVELGAWAAPNPVEAATDHLPVVADLPLVWAGQSSPSARRGR
jgi:endonuclease/exonuclease/phosphatase family metal-dependent hydrolase